MEKYTAIVGVILTLVGLTIDIYKLVMLKGFVRKKDIQKKDGQYKEIQKKSKWKGFIVGIIFMIVGLAIIFVIPEVFLKPQLMILSPKDGATINKKFYHQRLADNGKILIFTHVSISGRNLPENKYIHLLTAVSGGKEYWINSNPIPSDLVQGSEYKIHSVSFGTKRDGDMDYILLLLLTEEKMPVGSTHELRKLPNYIVKSQVVSVHIEK